MSSLTHDSRDALMDVALAIARTIEIDRVLPEVAQQIRRAIPTDAVAIAIADESSDDLQLAHQIGMDDDPDALRKRLGERWSEALEIDRVLIHETDDGVELTAPMRSGETALGAITLTSDRLDAPQRVEDAERLLRAIAAQTGAAIERARLVRRVERKRRLEAIGEVAAAIAHELRNPLFGISSAAQLLRFRAREDPVLERNVGRILREVERLNALVGDLLEYGAPRPLSLTIGDPDALWDEILEGNRGLLESRALTLDRIRPAHHARCELDHERMGQVFLNVLMNAVEAAPDASTLTLASAPLTNGGWRMTLRNGGEPVPDDVLPRVFELFFSTKRGGTGIGLALSRRIVEEHHGTITLDSGADGTTVAITLPPPDGA